MLCYHGVRPATNANRRFPFDYLHIPASLFDSHCRLIRETCDPISLDDWHAAVNGGPPLPKRPVLVTFDDGYRTVLTEAAPILAAHGLPAVVFVCTAPMTSTRVLWFDDLAAREGEESVEAWKSRDYDAWQAACTSTSPLPDDDPRALMRPAELATLAGMAASGDTTVPLRMTRSAMKLMSGPHSMAQPPSTGRSTPVIWRETSLARNRQALATSSSVETRLSA